MDDTHKHGPEVRVLIDVHVAQVYQQRRHAVEEADDGHAHEELGRGGGVSHQVCDGNRAVAEGGIGGHQGHLAQPGRRAKGENEERCSQGAGGGGWKRAMGFLPEGVVEVGVEGLVGAVATEHGHNVPRREAAAAPKGEDRRELCGQREEFGGGEV